ncbi:SirB2 family protein [Vibrio sp. SCSIO 43136]|uniref:SirB2 family protein n=1 Tax=Vibrio sp. SCSIO 43136 TaxID=2819101 RepID=UPI0020758864|nr:SirB2 family protein [Vibrio sp. SCSIO 43136]
MYPLLLKAHVLLIVLSFLSFLLRALWGFKGSEMLESKGALMMHKLITLTMLLSAAALCVTLNMYPMTDAWLTEKLVLLVAYVAFGMATFKPLIHDRTRAMLATVTCGLFVAIFYIAKLHAPIVLS